MHPRNIKVVVNIVVSSLPWDVPARMVDRAVYRGLNQTPTKEA